MVARPKIFDCFTYNGESSLLDLRIAHLEGVVDYMVIVEATRTFTGAAKALKFDRELLKRESPKILYLALDTLDPAPASAWLNEFAQRNALGELFLGKRRFEGVSFSANDRILLSDVDELPTVEAFAAYDPVRFKSAVLEQLNCYYAFNNVELPSEQSDGLWRAVRLTTVQHFQQWFKSMQTLRSSRQTGPFRALWRVRNKRQTQHLKQAGWHFSYLMTAEQILEKLQSFSHQEFNTKEIANLEFIRKCAKEGRSLFNDKHFQIVSLDERFPASLREQRDQFEKYIW